MLKTLQGRRYMTGTGEGALYPVVLWHENGLKLGVRPDIAKIKQGYGVTLYSRAQVFDEAGDDVVPTLEQLYVLKDVQGFRFASKFHVSGPLMMGVFQVKPNVTFKMQTEEFGKFYAEAVANIAKMLHLEMEPDTDWLKEIASEAWVAVHGNVQTEASIEQKMGAEPFDFMSLLDKPEPSDE